MALRYNSRQALESKLAILKCCIGTKAIAVSNSIALALGNVDCLVQELEVLTQYYDTLNCYYPYDCKIDLEHSTGQEVLSQTYSTGQEVDIASWITNGDSVVVRIYRPIQNDYITFPSTDPIVDSRVYIRNHATELGYNTNLINNNSINLLFSTSCNLIGNTNTWGVTILNVTTNASYVRTANLTGSIVCIETETECCNIKLIPEQASYTLVTPQYLASAFIGALNNTPINFNGSVLDNLLLTSPVVTAQIRNALDNTTVTIPIISNSRSAIITYIVNYINTNSAALGYTIISSGAVPNFYSFVTTVNECTQYQDDSVPMYWGFGIYLNGVLYEEYVNIVVLANGLYSTCAVYNTTIDRAESYECVENCITDEQAEKMMRHAMSYCECCLETKIDNEPFN